ncbi:hypothetical protein [Lacipirellula sp.]|uniref:hypothetical protein n=1 Tax=Lacipirellula sp. TaxID=2691419 RepID=UPI003D14CBED
MQNKRSEAKVGKPSNSSAERPVRALFQTAIVTLGVFALVSLNVNVPIDSVELEFALNWTQRAFGALISVAAGAMVLIRAAQREPIEELLPLTLAALVGVLIAASNWGVAVAIGAVGVAAVLSGRLSHRD